MNPKKQPVTDNVKKGVQDLKQQNRQSLGYEWNGGLQKKEYQRFYNGEFIWKEPTGRWKDLGGNTHGKRE